MDASLKRILRGISLELRHELEGWHDKKTGVWNPGDLERRLNEIGVWSDRPSKPLDEMPHLSADDKAARRLVDGYLQLRAEAGVERAAVVAEFVRESAYTWANRLFALRCMEARSIIEEVMLQKAAYAGRSLVHQRYLRKNPDAAKGEDDGLLAVLFTEFAVRSQDLPALFDPKSPAVALRPSVAALKRCVALLSGTETVRGQDPATDEVFAAPDAFGWAYQYWNADEKDRVFEMVRTKKGAKIQGADIIPATQLYTEPYMVKFLVQNSLGALWMGMYPDSKLCERWEFYVKDADRASVTRKRVREITFLDPAEGSGHFHLEAFDLFYAMYEEEAAREGRTLSPREIAASILNQNLYGIDIDGRSVQIATAALWMKAKERAPELEAADLTSFHEHLVATNIRLPRERNHLELFLQKHPEDKDLRPALELVFQGLEHADELGALLQIEELVDAVLRRLKQEADAKNGTAVQTGLFEPTLIQGTLPVSVEDYAKWKHEALNRLQAHFEAEAQAADAVQAFFSESATKGLSFFNLLSSRYDVVAANPPYMNSGNLPKNLVTWLQDHFGESYRDLYAVFIERAFQLLNEGGSAALVTMQSFMFIASFQGFRRWLVNDTRITHSYRLGINAFPEMGDHVNAVLTILQKAKPTGSVRSANLLRYADKPATLRDRSLDCLSEQSRIRAIPGFPLVFGLPPSVTRLFLSGTLLDAPSQVEVPNLSKTGNDSRFIRMDWELGDGPKVATRWKRVANGGLYSRWSGNNESLIDWSSGARAHYRQDHVARITEEHFWFKEVVTFSKISSAGFSCRFFPGGGLFETGGPSLISTTGNPFLLLGILNSSLARYILWILNPTINFQTGDVVRFPRIPEMAEVASRIKELAHLCVEDKKRLLATNPTSSHYCLAPTRNNPGITFATAIQQSLLEAFETEAALRLTEGEIDQLVFQLYGLDESAMAAVYEAVGMPTSLLKKENSRGVSRLEVLSGECQNRNESPILHKVRGLLSGNTEVPNSEPNADEDTDHEDLGRGVGLFPDGFLERICKELSAHPVEVLSALCNLSKENIAQLPQAAEFAQSIVSAEILRTVGHHWNTALTTENGIANPVDADGIVPLSKGASKGVLFELIQNQLMDWFPTDSAASVSREFEEFVGTSLEEWLANEFFEYHTRQFDKRPIAWQLETLPSRQAAVSVGKGKKKRAAVGKPVFACLVYYHKLDVDLLPKIRTQYVGLLRGGFETEFRTLEGLANPTGDQQARRLQLEQWTDELQTFDRLLEDVSLRGFGPDELRPALRQYGINDALLSLTACWLRRLSETVVKGPLGDWTEAATKTELHPDLPRWLQDSVSSLNQFCAVLGPKPPDEKILPTDPTSKELAPLICHQAKSMVEGSLKLGCDRWWKPLDETVLEPLRQDIKTAKEEIEKIDEELKAEGLPFQRRNELGERKHELKVKIKSVKADHDEKSDRARKIRIKIERWSCPEAETWEAWLCAQPLFDAVTSLDGQRPPPQSIADFITQESRYAPDINDGVRVNIAPIQEAGLLHADVLDAKDADKAIADRAEWRADERRWVREGKLPQPGWWKESEARL